MENIKDVLKAGIALAEAAAHSFEDGDLDTTDLVNLWHPLTLLPEAFESITKAGEEFKALGDEGHKALVEWVKEDFDIPQDNIEFLIEKALDLVLIAVQMVEKLRSK